MFFPGATWWIVCKGVRSPRRNQIFLSGYVLLPPYRVVQLHTDRLVGTSSQLIRPGRSVQFSTALHFATLGKTHVFRSRSPVSWSCNCKSLSGDPVTFFTGPLLSPPPPRSLNFQSVLAKLALVSLPWGIFSYVTYTSNPHKLLQVSLYSVQMSFAIEEPCFAGFFVTGRNVASPNDGPASAPLETPFVGANRPSVYYRRQWVPGSGSVLTSKLILSNLDDIMPSLWISCT